MVRRHNGVHPLHVLREEMDRLVGDFFGPGANALPGRMAGTVGNFPPLNVWEDGERFFVEAELPGLKHEDLELTVVENELTLTGRRGEPQREGVAYHRQERGVGEFSRVLRLPAEVDADKVEATMHDGVLLIKLPKSESAKPKKIKVVTPGEVQSS